MPIHDPAGGYLDQILTASEYLTFRDAVTSGELDSYFDSGIFHGFTKRTLAELGSSTFVQQAEAREIYGWLREKTGGAHGPAPVLRQSEGGLVPIALDPPVAADGRKAIRSRDLCVLARWFVQLTRWHKKIDLDAVFWRASNDGRDNRSITVGQALERIEAACHWQESAPCPTPQQALGKWRLSAFDPFSVLASIGRGSETLIRALRTYDAAVISGPIDDDGHDIWQAFRDYLHAVLVSGPPPKHVIDHVRLPWQAREEIRFSTGIYRHTPWRYHAKLQDILKPEHYLHLSTEDDGLVAYTPDAAKGEADRQVRLKPGRYLQKYYADKLTHDEIAELQGMISAVTLHITQSEKEIAKVYIEGPQSCLSGKTDSGSVREFQTRDIHPTAIYAGPDLALAYLTHNGRYTARALVWPEKKIYGRCYGDIARLKAQLTAKGYVAGDFVGARLRLIRQPHADRHNDESYVMAYVDPHGQHNGVRNSDGRREVHGVIVDDGAHMIIGGVKRKNGWHASRGLQSQSGLMYIEKEWHVSCKCGRKIDRSIAETVFGFNNDIVGLVCDTCLEGGGYAKCEHADIWYATEAPFQDVVIAEGGVTKKWSPMAVSTYGRVCALTGTIFSSRSMIAQRLNDGSTFLLTARTHKLVVNIDSTFYRRGSAEAIAAVQLGEPELKLVAAE